MTDHTPEQRAPTAAQQCIQCRTEVPALQAVCPNCAASSAQEPLPPLLIAYAASPAAPSGAAMVRPPPLQPPATQADHSLTSTGDTEPGRMPRRRMVLLTGGVVLLVALGTIIAGRLTGTIGTPEAPVQAFFTALSNHDGAALQQVASCHDSPLCTATGLAREYLAPQHVHLDAARDTEQPGQPTGTAALVRARYQLSSVQHHTNVTVVRRRVGLLRQQWFLLTPPGAWLRLHSTHSPTAQLAGANVPTSRSLSRTTDGSTSPVWAPIGTYTVAGVATPLLDAPRDTITVLDGPDPNIIRLRADVRPSVIDDVRRQIHDHLDACAAQPDLRPDTDPSPASHGTCPMKHQPPYTTIRDPRWTISRYPDITVRTVDDGTIKVHTTTPGTATVTYAWSTDVLEPRRWTPAAHTTTLTLGGHVELDNGAVRWHP